MSEDPRFSFRHVLTTLAVVLTLSLSACGGSGASTAEGEPETSTAEGEPETSTAEGERETLTAEGDDADRDVASNESVQGLRPLDLPDRYATVELSATEPGPRPLIAWKTVDGTARYDLTVLDSEGRPYWTWTGADTQIHLGGMEDPDAVGAWVFEPLVYLVTAVDADGATLAMGSGVLTN